MNDFNDLLKWIGVYFKEFCDDPDHQTESNLFPLLGGLSSCYDDPDLLFEDDNCPAQIEVFMEALMESIIHYKALLKKGGFLI